ncbi:AAA family ATPase [Streptomyces olivaceus]|uniref:helix-turn-helix transcriptional regulator n=1 Tax=Streptomyces olivaceus TaxID=47716 RepID=UPI00381C5B7B
MTRSFAPPPEPGREGLPPSFEPVSVGRIKTTRYLREALTASTGPAVLLLRGEVGSGRTALLDGLAAQLRSLGRPVLQTACLPGHHLTPCLLGRRLVAALAGPGAPAPPEHGAGARPAPDPQRPRPEPRTPGTEALFGALDAALRALGPVMVLVDDAQHADPESVSVLRRLTSRHTGLRLVLGVAPVRCGWPVEQQDERAALEPLSGDPGVETVDVQPLTADDLARILATRLRAVPDEGLVAELHRLSGGNPAAAQAAVGQAESDAIRVLIGHAHLVTGARIPVLPNEDRFIQTLRGLGDVPWRVAKALTLVEHMAPLTVELIATATGLSRGEVREALDRLTHFGFVRGPEDAARDRTWSFRVPLVARSVQARLGPYERRVTSATVVRALWRRSADEAEDAWAGQGGRDRAAYRACLADRIVDAGTMVDRDRAARELFAAAAELRTTHRRRASAWLGAAVERSDDPAPAVPVVMTHASDAVRAGDDEAVEATVHTLVRAQARADVPAERALAAIAIARTAAAGDLAGLCAHYRAQLAATGTGAAVLAVLAASLLGRWSEALGLIERGGLDQDHQDPDRAFVTVVRETARAMCGDPAELYRGLREPPALSPVLSALYGPLGSTLVRCEALLALGDLRGLTACLRRHGLTADRLPRHDVFLEQFLRGAWSEAMDNGRRLLVDSPPAGRVPVNSLLHRRMSCILLAQGWPARARTVLGLARSAGGPVSCPPDAEEAAIHRFHHRAPKVREALRRGLAEAAAGDRIRGTGPLWSALAVQEAADGHPEAALTCLEELSRVGGAADDVGRLLHLRTRLEAAALCAPLRRHLPDASSDGPEAVGLARHLGQPYELAVTLLLAATAAPGTGAGRRQLLWEAYEHFGRLDALLWRHRARLAMKDAGVPVPGPRDAAREMELLVARMVAEGLSNRQLATSLDVSETSVSSRLNRMFRRTEIRSRVELATAVVTGAPAFLPRG